MAFPFGEEDDDDGDDELEDKLELFELGLEYKLEPLGLAVFESTSFISSIFSGVAYLLFTSLTFFCLNFSGLKTTGVSG
ncbi:hypothetical protein AGMMS49990_01780 [Endomicrobiia bacterium]|nr:hypothetical protein AGMMS49990_01780 [Endomicrobiia bacterium]